MLKKIALVLAALTVLLPAYSPAALADTKGSVICGVNVAGGTDCSSKPKDTGSLDTTTKSILNILSSIVGAAAIIMIIFSGLRYIMSGGDTEKVKSAKRTLLFAIIGLALVALTQIIVHTVLTEANNAADSNSSPTNSSISPGAARSPH